MQTQASVAYFNNLKQAVSLQGDARLLAEWNQNRFAGPPAVVNTGYADADTDEFPLESIVSPNRPSKQGILKARASARGTQSGPGQTVEGYVQSAYDDSSTESGKRSYTVSSESKYKYWSSPTTSAAVSPYAISSGSLEVTYTKDIWMNKVVATFEAGVVQPRDISVYYKTTATGSWTRWAGTFQVDSKGVLTLYRQMDGTISSTQTLTAPLKIRGIKMVVANLSRANAHLNVIELSARLQFDLSDFVMESNADSSMANTSFVAPLGECSSNTGSIKFDNSDGRFDNDREFLRDGPENLLYGLIDKNIRFQMDLGVMVNGAYEYTRQFTMWSDEWDSQNEFSVGVSLKDSSKYLQSEKPNATLYQSVTTSGVIWRICDSVGFNDYAIEVASLNDNNILNFFWTDPEKTAWEHLQEISLATQTAVFFDEYDILRVLPRNAAYDIAKPVSWTFDAVEVGNTAASQGRPLSDNNKIADIVSLEQTYSFEANTVNIKFIPTSLSKMVGTIPTMEQVWSPEGDSSVVLRASRLTSSMTPSSSRFIITPSEAKLWPYQGVVQVEGEFIRYVKKGYTYRNASDVWVSTYLENEEEKKKYDDLNPRLAFANYFNGHMSISTPSNRGLWGTSAASHSVDISGWDFNRYRTSGGPTRNWNGGIIQNRNAGTYQMVTNKTFTPNSWYVSTRGASVDSPPVYYGTRLMFSKSGYGYGAAGIATNVGTNDSGYYIEVVRTAAITANDRAKYTNELVFYRKDANGAIKRMGPSGGKGVPVEIIAGVWYDLDVKVYTVNGLHTIDITLNGATRMSVTVPAGQGVPLGGRYGMFTRGWTSVEFEYFYSSTNAINDSFDEPGWWSRISGGYQSFQYDREWVYSERTLTTLRYKKPPLTVRQRYNSRMMDEFGPVVHEVREYDVKFDDKAPVLNSYLYLTNDAQVICPEYNGTPFGAKFVLANTARVNAVVNGDDTLTYGADNTVNQKMLIYGRALQKDEEQTVTVTDEASINRMGVVEVDLSSSWIQSKSSAESIGKWITSHWAGGSDEVVVETIGNPLIQIGDVVSVNHPNKSMAHSTHRYFVVGISHNFTGSMTSSFTLRRLKL